MIDRQMSGSVLRLVHSSGRGGEKGERGRNLSFWIHVRGTGGRDGNSKQLKPEHKLARTIYSVFSKLIY